MKLISCFLLYALALPLLSGQTDTACVYVENIDLIEYSCEGGSADDLNAIPSNAEKIKISRMPLVRVSKDTFSRFAGNLLVLTCSYCEISDIDESAFRKLQNLQQLSLDNNHLAAVKGTWFSGLRDLTYLDLNYNEIENIDGDVFRSSPALVDLRVSGNRLRCLDLDGISGLKELKRICLSENPEFSCLNAVSRFLADRSIDFEFDSKWGAGLPEDSMSANEPLPSSVPYADFEGASSTPVQVPRIRWFATEKSETYPPPPLPTTWNWAPSNASSNNTRTDTPPITRGPYVTETIQPSMPEQDFAYQGPYYAPKLTQQQFDDVRSAANDRAQVSEAEEVAKIREESVMFEAPTIVTLLAARVAGEEGSTTTGCPNAADLNRDSSLPAALVIAAISLHLSRWTAMLEI